MTRRAFLKPVLRLLCPLMLCLALGACAARGFDDPVAMMTNRQAAPEVRQRAADQAQRQMPRDPRRIAALHQLLWERGYPESQRRYAIDELIQIDEAEFRRVLARRIVLIQNWETLEYIFKLAVERQWVDFTPTLVRQYARTVRGMADKDRPERAVIEKLNPGKSIEQAVFEVFANADEQTPSEQQVAAWELLNRLAEKERLIELLDKSPDRTPLVIDLKAAAADLHTLPANKEGVLWLSYLRDPKRQEFWRAAKACVARLSPEQRRGLELRHLPVLLWAYPEGLAASRATLTAEIRARIVSAEHYLKAPTHDGQDADYPQRFEEWMDRLAWGDLLVIQWLAEAVQDPQVRAEFFAQADADHEDRSTEYGGVLLFSRMNILHSSQVVARLCKPLVREHDLKYVAPPELVEALYTGLAHYHFHAQDYHNADHAGPGRGDLELAGRLNFNGLVLTFINRDRLNVDYYQAGGVVIDLGTLSR